MRVRNDGVIKCSLRDVPGYGGKYLANPTGQIVRAYKNGGMKLMVQYLTHNKFMVKLSRDGVSRTIPASAVILETFIGPCPAGMAMWWMYTVQPERRDDEIICHIRR